MEDKCICRECGWKGTEDKLLSALNPFDTEDTILGCPDCKSIESCVRACDVYNCWAEACCGYPVDDKVAVTRKYMTTCGKHYKK